MLGPNLPKVAVSVLLASAAVAAPVAEPKKKTSKGSDPPATTSQGPLPSTSATPPPPSSSNPPPPTSTSNPPPPPSTTSSSNPPPPSSTSATSSSASAPSSSTSASSNVDVSTGSATGSGSVTSSASVSATSGSVSSGSATSSGTITSSASTTMCTASGKSGSSACASSTGTATHSYYPVTSVDGWSNVMVAPGVYQEAQPDADDSLAGSLGGLNSTSSSDNSTVTRRTDDKDNGMVFQPQGATKFTVYPATYGGWEALGNSKGYFYATTTNPTNPSLAFAATKPQTATNQWVVEHVFEKETFRDILQDMTKGAGGATAANVAGIFDQQGIFMTEDWTATTRWGQYPYQTAFGWLGHTDPSPANRNFDNFLVLERNINGMKANIMSKNKPLGDTTWRKFRKDAKGGDKMLSALAQVVNVFQYLNEQKTKDAFKSAYTGLHDAFWPDFAKLANAQQGYDYAAEFKTALTAHLKAVEATAQTNFKARVKDAQTWWDKESSKYKYTAADATAAKAVLTAFETTWLSEISLDISGMVP